MISSCVPGATYCLLVWGKATVIEHQLPEGLVHYSSDERCHLLD